MLTFALKNRGFLIEINTKNIIKLAYSGPYLFEKQTLCWEKKVTAQRNFLPHWYILATVFYYQKVSLRKQLQNIVIVI